MKEFPNPEGLKELREQLSVGRGIINELGRCETEEQLSFIVRRFDEWEQRISKLVDWAFGDGEGQRFVSHVESVTQTIDRNGSFDWRKYERKHLMSFAIAQLELLVRGPLSKDSEKAVSYWQTWGDDYHRSHDLSGCTFRISEHPNDFSDSEIKIAGVVNGSYTSKKKPENRFSTSNECPALLVLRWNPWKKERYLKVSHTLFATGVVCADGGRKGLRREPYRATSFASDLTKCPANSRIVPSDFQSNPCWGKSSPYHASYCEPFIYVQF